MNADITHDTTSQDAGFLIVEKQKFVTSHSRNSISFYLKIKLDLLRRLWLLLLLLLLLLLFVLVCIIHF